MPTPQPDYYAVLNLKPAATQAEIKQRYRELARLYHPDVNHSPDAAQKIKSVNEAHRVLADPDRRALYDAERILNPPAPTRTETAAQRSADRDRSSRPNPAQPSAQDTRRSPAGSRPAGASRVEFNGFGRVTPEGANQSRADQARARKPVGPNPADLAAADRLVSEAEVAFLTRNYSDAERLCREALIKNRSSAGAHEVLGDIHAMRGHTESAVNSYSFAIQFNPRSYSAQGKLDRLIGRRPSASGGPAVNRSKAVTRQPRAPGSRVTRELVMGLTSLMLFAGGCAVIAEYSQNAGVPIGGAIPWITMLSTNLIIALVLVGVIAGMLLAFYGKLRPISEELSQRADGHTRRNTPLLVILTLFSVVWFYASLLVYVGIAVGRDRVSTSTVRVYGLVLALVALFTVIASASERGAWLESAAFAGNILFPAALLGWFFGDSVRLRTL
jgi:curved DNA-binding protein CbpA